jgi:hypothetical protein
VSSRGTFRGVYCSLVDSVDFQRLSPRARHVFLTARLGPQTGPAGIFRYYPDVLAEQTGWSVKEIKGAVGELVDEGWAQLEDGILWLVNALKYDPNLRLNNAKHITAVENWLASLPRRSIVLRFCVYYGLERLSHSLSGYLSQVGSQEKEKEKEQEKEKKTETLPPSPLSGGAAAEAVWATPENLVALYNAEAPDNVSAVEELSAKRRDKARRALRQYPDEGWWKEVFAQYRRSRFLRGLTPPRPGHTSFRPDFDWLISVGKNGVENFVKVHDGMYAD